MYRAAKNKKNSGVLETVLGEGTVFEGTVSCEGSIKIEGVLNADIEAGNSVVVGPNGRVTGKICATEVVIFGKVTGNIDAGTLEIKNTGEIKGEILVERLITESGGIMRARCEMKDSGDSGAEDSFSTPDEET
ncbi:MAG: polymer-forming cytoskeletal protein [Candidatus Dadabacteria bacterium]|nr:polymer-forming cytoskeletal protein [Candidatus Dadabacteria bacterium]MCY4262547.1 polymer-forming cytoskeletal protein [Candidatus Dadabacteria bacterium]